jgi:branched-chain amino acid transport system ATP-binding protein
MSEPLLALRRVTLNFGGLRAVADLDLELPKGGLYGLIGPTGAGKTTVFNLITGVYAPTRGSILLEGRPIQGQPTSRIAGRGVSRTFQSSRLFPDLTCLDNVRIACHLHGRLGIWGSMIRSRGSVAEEEGLLSRAEALLSDFGLAQYRDQEARNLPYGEMRRLEIARTVATEAKLVLLDEPAAGMNPQETEALMRLIHDIRDRYHLTVLLIEHDMRVVMGICERITVLDHGVKISEGPPEAIRRDSRVIEAYLGDGA